MPLDSLLLELAEAFVFVLDSAEGAELGLAGGVGVLVSLGEVVVVVEASFAAAAASASSLASLSLDSWVYTA